MESEHIAILVYDVVLVICVSLLAYFMTPWALCGLIFLAVEKDSVTVERPDGTTVTVESGEIDRGDVRRAVEQASK